MRFIYTKNFVSSDLFNANGASLLIFTMNLNRCCTKFAKYMAGTYETSLILDPSFQIHGRKLQYVANPRPPKLWTPRPDLKGPPAKSVQTGEAYTPSRFLQNNHGSIHQNMMFQGPDILTLSLILKDCAQLLHIPVTALTVGTNMPCDFSIIFYLKPGFKDLLSFCKAATDKILLGDLDSIIGWVLGYGILQYLKKLQREWHNQ